MEETKDTALKSRITLVCTGKTHLKAGEVGLVFRTVDGDGGTGRERIYSHKNLKTVRVGAVYDVDTDPEDQTAIHTNSLRWIRLWENQNEAAAWQVAADAFDTRELAARQERKETSRKLPVELLEPIREQYWATNAAGRLAIEVRVLAYLRRVTLSQGAE